MTPSWYDILDVESDASAEEIRAAWRAAIADLDPADRRFRTLNQAAEVLLDPAARSAYDATLVPVVDDAPLATGDEPVEPPAPAPVGSAAPRAVRSWVLVTVAIVALLLVAATAWVATRPDEELLPAASEGGVGSIEASAQEAEAVARRAIVPVLSYDYRHLDEDQAAAHTFMTSSYRSGSYDPLFETIKENAPSTKTVVSTQVIDSGIVRTSADDDRVEVLLFVNRPITNKAYKTPRASKDQVTVTMVRVDGDWLIDDLTT